MGPLLLVVGIVLIVAASAALSPARVARVRRTHEHARRPALWLLIGGLALALSGLWQLLS